MTWNSEAGLTFKAFAAALLCAAVALLAHAMAASRPVILMLAGTAAVLAALGALLLLGRR